MRGKLVLLPFALAFVALACEWDPARPLEHYAPAVDQALEILDAGDASAAAGALAAYLDSNQCEQGQIAISKALEEKARAGLDLSLVLFRIAESYGQRFTDDQRNEQGPPPGERSDHVSCALAVARALGDAGTPLDRARAAFVEGNLLFFNGAYKEAVLAYDRALILAPPSEGDDTSMGADVAFNRAIALKRSKEEPDAGPDGGGDDASSDAASNDAASADSSAPSDASNDDNADSSSPEQPDADTPPPDSGTPPPEHEDAGASEDAGAPPPPPPPEEMDDAGLGLPPPEALDRLLDELERAPTVQQEIIRRERPRRMRPEEDK